MARRILVTGGTGFLGGYVVEALRDRGYDVVALGRRAGDLTARHDVERILDQHTPDAVIHLAARCGGIGANRGRPADFLTDNALMGLHLLRACAERRIAKVVALGTICAYPKHTPAPFREASLWDGYPEETNAPYGVAKRMLLTAAQAHREQYGLNAVTLFPTNLYGPRDHFTGTGNHVIPALIARFWEAKARGAASVTLWGDGAPTREFLYAADCAAAIVRALERYDDGDPLNLGSGEEVSIRTLAEMLAELVGYHGALAWDVAQPNGQPRRLVDSSRARQHLGWQAQVGLAEGLQRTIAWYAQQQIGMNVAPEDEGMGEG